MLGVDDLKEMRVASLSCCPAPLICSNYDEDEINNVGSSLAEWPGLCLDSPGHNSSLVGFPCNNITWNDTT